MILRCTGVVVVGMVLGAEPLLGNIGRVVLLLPPMPTNGLSLGPKGIGRFPRRFFDCVVPTANKHCLRSVMLPKGCRLSR